MKQTIEEREEQEMSLEEIKKELVEKEVIKPEYNVIAVRHDVFCGITTIRYEAIILSDNFIPYSVLAHKSGKYSIADYNLSEYEEV